MSNYLYGASVQGIQGFIFQTNKLREIIGASYLVDTICQSKFKFFCDSFNHQVDDDHIITAAAGSIKYLVDEATCEKIVAEFPKFVSNYAPGITISQAVVKETGNIKTDIDTLETKLRLQRNRSAPPVDTGFMGLERARRTGGVASNQIPDRKAGTQIVDRGTEAKVLQQEDSLLDLYQFFKKGKVSKRDVPWDIEDICGQSDNSWVAIVHADGNGIGKLLQVLANKIDDNEQAKAAFKTFSKNLDKATKEATQIAFQAVITDTMEKEILQTKARYPLRPVILGGDDLTLIIRADLALKFTTEYLKAFEVCTKKHFQFLENYGVHEFKEGLTACAGIAYIKQAYPFHYGVNLAESLTKEAKEMSKSKEVKTVYQQLIPPSSLSFYKVQSSFTNNLAAMKDRTLEAKNAKIRFDYGPYMIHKKGDFANMEDLESKLKILNSFAKKDAKGVSKLRNWLSVLHKNKEQADFLMDRMAAVNTTFYKELNLVEERHKSTTILFELMQLQSM